MLFRIASAALKGINAYPVEVEVDISLGLPRFVIVGLPDAAVRESRERIHAALKNCGYGFSSRKIIINLSPADQKKEGSAFDLPMALGLLAHLDLFPPERLHDYLFIGELALDGRLNPGKGALATAVLAQKSGFAGVVVPRDNEREAALVQDVQVAGMETLSQVIGFLNKPESIQPAEFVLEDTPSAHGYTVDFSEINGQQHAKRALEVAAAGAHNVLLIGPPGAGKTMLARRLATIFPPMTFDEIIEVTLIYSAAGLVPEKGMVDVRPLRAPHHTISKSGLIGGGRNPIPGEISLAHHGVLFLDELPEFQRDSLESLRQPAEDGIVTISRVLTSVTFPASFMLVAAMNPCEDALYGKAARDFECTESQRMKYYSKISGPLLDRIDIQIDIPRVNFGDLISSNEGERSERIRERVVRARDVQLHRFCESKVFCNARMNACEVKRFCCVGKEAEELLEMAVEKLSFSARAYSRVLKVARTIADLSGEDKIQAEHISEAIQYRLLDF